MSKILRIEILKEDHCKYFVIRKGSISTFLQCSLIDQKFIAYIA